VPRRIYLKEKRSTAAHRSEHSEEFDYQSFDEMFYYFTRRTVNMAKYYQLNFS